MLRRTTVSVYSLLLSLYFLGPLSTHAADKLYPVVVTATRTAESADETLSPMIVIDAATIAQNPGADVADLLRQYTGIEIGRNGGPGQTTSIFIRGTNNNHALVMVDGVKINPGTIGGASIQNIEPSIIERIEVVKGPRSTLYGSDAIGGVINIITKRAKLGTQYDVAVGAGSYDTKSLKLNAQNRTTEKAAGIQISGTNSRGFSTLSTSTVDRGYDNLSINLYGSQKIGASNVEVSHWRVTGKVEYLDYSLIPIDQNFRNDTTAVTIKNSPTSNWGSTVKLSHFTDKIQQNQSADFVETARNVLDWQNDVQLGKSNLLTAGLLLSAENAAYLSYGAFDVDTTVGAMFVQDIWEHQAHKLVIGARYTKHETFGTHTTWSMEYGYRVNSQLKLIIANNSGFRAPDSTDRFGYGGYINLKPETSVNSEIGLRYLITPQQRLELNAFDNKIDNLFRYNNLTLLLENINETEIKGVEILYGFAAQHWALRASAAVQNPYDITNNQQLLRRAKHIYNVYGGYKTDSSDTGLNISYSGNRPDIDAVTFATVYDEAYTLLNLTSRYQFTRQLALAGRLENLTNENYVLAAGYKTPERSLFLELQYHLD